MGLEQSPYIDIPRICIMQEAWKTIGKWGYEVSNLGNIRRSIDGINTFAGRYKHPSKSSTGYLITGLFKDGKRKNIFVHRAVVESFIGQIPDGMEVNHKDGNKLNNHLDNLEIVTFAENFAHAQKNGLIASDFFTRPRKRYYGEEHWTHKKPERLARGDNNGSRTHPEKLKRGSEMHNSKINEEDVKEIRSLKELGVHNIILTKMYGVTRTNIQYIVGYKSWGHVI